jgi:nucleotide-binding universal stress UspA family protein
MYKHILVPVDGSKTSDLALHEARQRITETDQPVALHGDRRALTGAGRK